METREDMLQSDFFETQWTSNKDDARDSFIDEVKRILMPIEHHVSSLCDVEVNNVPQVANAINQVSNLRFYSYTKEVEGKYQLYEETFEYDFTEELKDLLRDELGYSSNYFLTLTLGDN